MVRNLPTFVDVWMEFDQGLAGNPPVRRMDEVNANKWIGRNDSSTNREHYRKRKAVWDEIERQSSAEGQNPMDVARQMDWMRAHNADGSSKTLVSVADFTMRLLKAKSAAKKGAKGCCVIG